METLDIEKFDPTVTQLTEMVKKTKKVKVTDFEDKKQIAIVHENRIALKGTRVKIEKTGKALRENAVAFQKAVIAKEKELIAIIEPEETRLLALEDEAENLSIKKDRLEKLPSRIQRLTDVDAEIKEEHLLSMDDFAFESYLNARTVEFNRIQNEKAAKIIEEKADKIRKEQEYTENKLAAERALIESDRLANEREKQRLENEKTTREREEKAREEERKNAKIEAERKENERIESEKLVKEKEKAEKDRIEKLKAYKAFRTGHGYTEETKTYFKEENTGNEVILWKKVGTFKLK